MKLYAVPYGTNVRIRDADNNTLRVKFHYVDGMYTYCTDAQGNVINLALWADVEIDDGHPAQSV